MSMLIPCTTPVVPALPNTGALDTWLIAGAGSVVVLGGIAAVIMAKTLKGKLTALALPVFAVAGLALGNPQPSMAATGAPTVVTEASVVTDWERVGSVWVDTISFGTAPVFNNPENCGTMSYQWQTRLMNSNDFVNTGAATATYATFSANDCDPYAQGRLVVTLTNSSGSATSTSNPSWLCD